MNTSKDHQRPKRQRIILLLDLDCFYAQCEMIRLNIDRNVPLCLLQWNSALAINYPARDLYKFKRGVSFDEIQKKSQGKCVALHLPVISLDATSTYYREDDMIQSIYDREYNQPQHIKAQMYEKEKNVMRKPHEGKASIERYRIASACIFETIKNALDYQKITYRKNKMKHSKSDINQCDDISESDHWFILEKASIDELYLDVTNICYDFAVDLVWNEHHTPSDDNDDDDAISKAQDDLSLIEQMALEETFICAKDNIIQSTGLLSNDNKKDFDLIIDDNDDDIIKALRRGCTIARGIRKVVYDKLGFTLSAGISTSKLVAKLGASYGKPNGQAVVFPQAIPFVMNETPIRKARNLGGKIGKEVEKLLPRSKNTMSCIEKYLSLHELTQALGHQTAKIVFDACRGIDEEPVRETKGALSKSITAFKSFAPTIIKQLTKWITLLATDIFARVSADIKRNNRFPKSCTIQFYYRREKNSVTSDTIGSSVRTSFPSNLSSDKIPLFVNKVQELIETKCDERICRLGLSATGFVERATQNAAISSFFQSSDNPIFLKKEKDDILHMNSTECIDSPSIDPSLSLRDNKFSYKNGNEQQISRKPEKNQEIKPGERLSSLSTKMSPIRNTQECRSIPLSPCLSDLEYAKRLQASYDRENEILSRSTLINKSKPCQPLKKARIDSFFKTKK